MNRDLALLCQMAAAIAAGIEASQATDEWIPEQTARRAIEIAAEIVALITKAKS